MDMKLIYTNVDLYVILISIQFISHSLFLTLEKDEE